MRTGALLLAILFAASIPTVAEAAKAKRVKAKPAAAGQADPDAALKLVVFEGLPGFLLPAPLMPLWLQHVEQQKKAAGPRGKRVRRS
jgi:hypothetical protein